MSQHLIASKCTRCSRKLTDPVSIACGIGPECRKQMGFSQEFENDSRLRSLCTEVNIRTFDRDYLNAFIAINEINLAGFPAIASTMEDAVKLLYKRQEKTKTPLPIIAMSIVGETIRVWAPYKVEALSSWRGLMVWNKEKKHYEAPAVSFNRRGFMEHLRSHYQDCMVMGPKGVFWPTLHENPVRYGAPGFNGVVGGKPAFSQVG